MMRTFKVCEALFVGTLLALAIAPFSVAQSPFWMNFYGQVTSEDGEAIPGAEIKVYADRVLCGSGTSRSDGTYGLLPVYGDDPTTPEKDGAIPGDTLIFYVNGQEAGSATWTGHGDVQRLDLVVKKGVIPPERGKVYVDVIVWGGIPIPIDMYVAGELYDSQMTAVNGLGEQQATFILWPELGEQWNMLITPRLPPALDPSEWEVEVREGALSTQVEWGQKPIIYLQLAYHSMMTLTDHPVDETQAVEESLRQYWAALAEGDYEALTRFTTDDFVFLENGARRSMAAIIDEMRELAGQLTIQEYSVQDMETRVEGWMAYSLFDGHWTLRLGDKDMEWHLAYSAVCRKQNATWRIVLIHATTVPRSDG